MRNNDVIREIKSRISLADLARRYIELRSVGSRLVAPCPFHQETKPSFSIDDEQGYFYCFGCQASGDIFDFYSRINGLDFKDTLAALAEEAGVRLDTYRSPTPEQNFARSKKSDMLKMHDLAAGHFRGNLRSSNAKECRDYILERGINPDLQDRFAVGWSSPEWHDLCDLFRRSGFSSEIGTECGLLAKSDSGRYFDRFRNRLMFPIKNLAGKVIAFGGRILPSLAKENDAKYINSSDSPIYKKGEHLFGLFQARQSISVKKSLILTEGYMDVLTLHQFGYTNAAGVLGTALTPEQIKRISGFTSDLELMFDGDNAGKKAAFRSCEMLLTRGLNCKVIIFPDDNDIDSMLRTYGKNALEDLRKNALSGLDFCISVLRTMAPKDAVDWARNFLSQISLPEFLPYVAGELANGLGISEDKLRNIVADKQISTSGQGKFYPPSKKPKFSRDKEILTFAVRYPHLIPELQAYNADLLLNSDRAKLLWKKLSHFCSEEAFSSLDDWEKKFWVFCRGKDAPPLDNGKNELNAILTMLKNMESSTHQDSLLAALRQSKNSEESQREYLRAMLEARGRFNEYSS